MNRIKTHWVAILAPVLLSFCSAFAQEEEAAPSYTEEELAQIEAYEVWAEEFEGKLKPQTGNIPLVNSQIMLEVPESFAFFNKSDGRAILEEAWGNPPDNTILGMIFPAGRSVLDTETWGILLSYDDDGYVSDEDAVTLDYAELLKTMQEQTETENAERIKEGYGRVDLIGWAEQPSYNPDTHKIYWAKELFFEGSDLNTLNYNVRVLGRRGVLNLNFIAGMDQLEEIRLAAPAVLEIANFTENNRYTDYQPGDKVADYGIAALVAGGAGLALVKKSGFLAILLVALKKFGVFIIAGLAAAFTAIRRMMGGNKS